MKIHPLEHCRVCGAGGLEPVLALGDMPFVNSFVDPARAAAPDERFPLAIAFCAECSHVQLTHYAEPEGIFTQYIYFSSMADAVVKHGEALAAEAALRYGLAPGELVAEVASNDGCILKPFRARGLSVLGVEPARNVAEAAIKDGIDTVVEFFGRDVALRLASERGRPKLLIARNVLAHVPPLRDFVGGLREWLAPGGAVQVEVPHALELIDRLAFDTIYDEHVSYFTVHALVRLFESDGLEVFDVRPIELHGGSVIVFAQHRGGPWPRGAGLERELSRERERGLTTAGPWRRFARRVEAIRESAPAFLRALKARGLRVAGYGAAAKGNVLLNFCGIGPTLVEFVADKSPHKQGLLTPGTRIPVVPPARILEAMPDVLAILAWNFADEIVRQQAEYAACGGRFALLLPEPRLLEPGAS